MKINIISDSTYTVQGHGVHTAFIQHVDALKKYSDARVVTNDWHLNNDVVHIHTFGFLGVYHAIFDRGLKIMSAHVVPESWIGSLVGANLWMPIASRFLKWFYNRADVLIAVSPATAENLKNKMKLKPPVITVPNAIDTERFKVTPKQRQEIRKKLGFGKDDFVVLGCGQLQPRKRIDSFVTVAKKTKDIKFVWAGGVPFKRLGADSSEMNKLMELNLPNLNITGVIPYDSAIEYFKAADAFFLPSEQETFGLVIIEAAAAGLPVIVRDIPDYKETFGDYVLKVNEDGFISVINKLKTDKGFYDEAAKNSAKLANLYDNAAYARKVMDLYHDSLRPKR